MLVAGPRAPTTLPALDLPGSTWIAGCAHAALLLDRAGVAHVHLLAMAPAEEASTAALVRAATAWHASLDRERLDLETVSESYLVWESITWHRRLLALLALAAAPAGIAVWLDATAEDAATWRDLITIVRNVQGDGAVALSSWEA